MIFSLRTTDWNYKGKRIEMRKLWFCIALLLTKLWIMCKIQYRKLDNYVIVSEYTCNRIVICFKCENWRR